MHTYYYAYLYMSIKYRNICIYIYSENLIKDLKGIKGRGLQWLKNY